ncbi:hypothetical protein C9374_004974 [Naegleria lovaniensis]|uniref:Uncharacterized protein n=1 Tax=Naegleria lovaniensis TaxID=51637 RepID=A0AA88GR56_NAELO|nr:uncharacterized protein C9374_004974 [Naegleria lovaniensis]KAG2383007.1 hypothetical protein C9374_004974 [Naegleria lovaniensis]
MHSRNKSRGGEAIQDNLTSTTSNPPLLQNVLPYLSPRSKLSFQHVDEELVSPPCSPRMSTAHFLVGLPSRSSPLSPSSPSRNRSFSCKESSAPRIFEAHDLYDFPLLNSHHFPSCNTSCHDENVPPSPMHDASKNRHSSFPRYSSSSMLRHSSRVFRKSHKKISSFMLHRRKAFEVFEEETLEFLHWRRWRKDIKETQCLGDGCENERPFCRFLWKQNREYIFVLIPIVRRDGDDVNMNDGRLELKVEIHEQRVKAFLQVREEDERFREEVLLDSSLSVTIHAKESNWGVIYNNYLFLELKKHDLNDDVHYPFSLPLKIEHKSNHVNAEVEYVLQPSEPPLHHEMHSEWFQYLVEDILECHKDYEKLKKDLILSSTGLHQFNLEEAALKYHQALEMPELSDAYIVYREAADLGHAQARYAFANLCLLESDNPFGIVRSEDQALHYLQLASFQNNYAKASVKIATMYLKGVGNERKDITKAKLFYVESIIQSGDAKPMLQLGNIYEEMASQTEDEIECKLLRKKAMSWYRLAVNRGFANACISASLLLHKCKKKDLAASMIFFKIGRVFSGSVDDTVAHRKDKLASIEESDSLYIPHYSPRKTIRSVKSVVCLKRPQPLRLEQSSTHNNSKHNEEREDMVDLIGYTPIDSSKFHLPGGEVLLKNQVKTLQVDKLALETKIQEITDRYEKIVASMKIEINNLRAELEKSKSENESYAREMKAITTMREAFQQQELRIAIHHALLSLKIRANVNIELPPLVDRAVEENVKMEEISSWFKRQTGR